MCIDNEIQNAIAFYEVLKTDLNTLLVKGSKSPLDYLGEIETQPYAVTIEYQISEPNQNRETFDLLVSIPQAVISWLQLYHAGSRVALEMM